MHRPTIMIGSVVLILGVVLFAVGVVGVLRGLTGPPQRWLELPGPELN